VQKVVELNKKALAAFADLNLDEAIKFLKEALEVCETHQLEKHPAAARTHVHWGRSMWPGSGSATTAWRSSRKRCASIPISRSPRPC